MELNECINFLLTKAQHTVFQYLKANLAQFDVTPVQYGILKCLWDEDGQTPKQIARTLSLDGSTITGILDRMENKNLVRRTPDPDDRRTLKVVITDQGLELRECIEEVIEEVNKHILKIFTFEEQEQLKKFLGQIANRQIF
ncbi:MarR family transcriptional regulator [Clostridium sp. OS1-26]|uniref:MarR family winged helix-turn-helix transcriptional regulator n=1 Tax=Clostridium sp. OS1-26 TaxID=3070681 RepID=UPI0027E1F0C1|nr:MarR family transcriptional regulator [Clostridium sp. OS1-26]WML34865.1 MarR family transcriptional regulator [Clostridium sp. OS1-26]